MISKIVIQNYKLIKNAVIPLNSDINIFVGDNDSGKSTILEALTILTTGKLNGYALDRQLKANLFNNEVRAAYRTQIEAGQRPFPPEMIFEAYFDGDPLYKGSQNSLSEDTVGLRIKVAISEANASIYQQMLANNDVKDIPVELYTVTCRYFSGELVSFRYSPFKSVFIDTGHKEYANLVDRFVTDSISDNLTEAELTDLAIAYKSSRRAFQENDVVKKLNESVRQNPSIQGKTVSLDLREDETDAWKRQMSIVVDDIPFEHIGFGTQNSIKIELALRNADAQANVVIMEEPENNLSFTNMTKLVGQILKSTGKQVFLSTHSSYIANKLDLSKVLLVNNGAVAPFGALSEDTKKYFVKLPGYDTLRFVLAEKIILVEGPTDDLIIQRAYMDKYGHLPSDDGIDIFVVDSLAFKRFCEIGKLVGKKVVVVTDNDGDIAQNIHKKYEDYYGLDDFKFYYESDEVLHTIEPSVLAVNCETDGPTELFKRVISARGSMMNKSKEEILSFMKKNKAEWAYRVFEATDCICYPEYIRNVIKHFE